MGSEPPDRTLVCLGLQATGCFSLSRCVYHHPRCERIVETPSMPPTRGDLPAYTSWTSCNVNGNLFPNSFLQLRRIILQRHYKPNVHLKWKFRLAQTASIRMRRNYIPEDASVRLRSCVTMPAAHLGSTAGEISVNAFEPLHTIPAAL